MKRYLRSSLLAAAFSALPAAFADPPQPAWMEAARAYSEANGGTSLLVLHDGETVFEAYGNGGSAGKRAMLASGTKSFAGAVAAAAVEDGFIEFDEPVAEHLPEWKDDPLKSGITPRHLLSLTSGLPGAGRGASARGLPWKETVALPTREEPGARFSYGPNPFNAFGEALQRKLKAATGESYEQYLERRLFGPLGIEVEWTTRCPDGNPQLGGGASMTARDWAAFGEFMRQGGKRGDRQIVAGELLAECLRGSEANPGYGMGWWLNPTSPVDRPASAIGEMGGSIHSDRLPNDLHVAMGLGKQRLYIIPSMKLVVVRQGTFGGARGFDDEPFLDRLLRGGDGGGESGGEGLTRPSRRAAGAEGTAESIFRRLDADNDGKLKREDFEALGFLGRGRFAEDPEAKRRLFDRLDTDADGLLTLEEARQLGDRSTSLGP